MANGLLQNGIIERAGARSPGWSNNLQIISATTTNSSDSIKITGNQGTALSASNPGHITVPDSSGNLDVYTLTSDVTINLTGAHWGAGGNGDLSSSYLRVVAINDNNATLRFGVALQGGRQTIASTVTSATGTDINLPEEILVDTALTAGTWAMVNFAYFKANFDDTGGVAEDLWTVQSAVGTLRLGVPDGLWQSHNPVVTGYSSSPTITTCRWCMIGNAVYFQYFTGGSGTSNATSHTISLPIKANAALYGGQSNNIVNGGSNGSVGACITTANSVTLNLYRTGNVTDTWTASGSARADACIVYESL